MREARESERSVSSESLYLRVEVAGGMSALLQHRWYEFSSGQEFQAREGKWLVPKSAFLLGP